MPPFSSSTGVLTDSVTPSVGLIRPAEDRPRTVTAKSALGHVLRRLEQEAANPDVAHFAAFESSIDFEVPMR